MAAAFMAQSAFVNAQGLDFDAINALPPPPTYTMDVGVAAQTVTLDQASLIASVVSAVSADPISTANPDDATLPIDDSSKKAKRQAASSTCTGGTVQPTGCGPVSNPDTPAGFKANTVYASIASAAPTPSGYSQVFQNLAGSTSDYGYLGYTTLTSYDVATCAAKCTAKTNCHSFNICKLLLAHLPTYILMDILDFERDPTVDPGSGTNCANPASTTLIKCVYCRCIQMS